MRKGEWIVCALALTVGLCIGYVDSRPTWDDTGITVGALVLSAGLLASFRPRTWWLTGLLIGIPVPLLNYLNTGRLQAGVGLVIALVSAGIGGMVGKALGVMKTQR